MTELDYPWRWLSGGVGTAFVLRYPWIEAALRAAGRSQAVCVLVPEAAGPVASWGRWLSERIEDAASASCLRADGDFGEVARVLTDAYQVGERPAGELASEWSRRFLAECRREMPHASTVPLLVVGADDACAAALQDLARAQRDLGYPFVRPVLLRRSSPPEWDGETVRFGLPEWVGDLNRIDPPPTRDLDFWTNLLLALTVAWEAGAIPQLAGELWDTLQLNRTVSLRDSTFDAWLDRELTGFAKRSRAVFECPLPACIAFGPLRTLGEEGPWHRGAVAWEGDGFDVTPLQARLWTSDLDEDARAALRRRRLTNVPLARWLSAWAASVEESLRVAVLQAGGERFRRFLGAQPPRQRGSPCRSRLEELDPEGGGGIVDRAHFGDLAEFLSRHPPRPSLQAPARLLEACRVSRNRVVHQRLVATSDFLNIANTAYWLSLHAG